MLPRGFLDRYEDELRFVTLQTRREDMQWRREPKSPAVDAAIASADRLNVHLSQSIHMLRAQAEVQVTPLPTVSPVDTNQKVKPMTDTPATGFAAQIKAMVDEARAEAAKARTDALATVQEGIGDMKNAAVATITVAGTMSKSMKNEAASIMAELGQISNMPPE